MEPESLTVLGAASVRFGDIVCGGLATYFGERPLEIRFWDADAERLDLFDRYARYLFRLNKTPHQLRSMDDPKEALFGADRVLISVEENCALHFLGPDGSPDRVVDQLTPAIPDGAEVLDLRGLEGIPEPDESQLRALPHQILRYIRGDDYAYDLLREQAESPVKRWLQSSQR